jgi:hypothetical protein
MLTRFARFSRRPVLPLLVVLFANVVFNFMLASVFT